MSTPGSAETLRDALTKAYKSNPTLTGTRAGQRANDENVQIERRPGLPQVNADGSYTETLRQSGASINSLSRFTQGGVTMTVHLYRGRAAANGVKAAKARVAAAQAIWRSTEHSPS